MIKVESIHDLANIKGKVVTFDRDIVNWECYADQYMKARVVGYRYNTGNDTEPSEIVHDIIFDFSEFDEHNQKYEQSNYWDKNGQATLTAREAGYYHPQESIYFGEEMPLTLVDEAK